MRYRPKFPAYYNCRHLTASVKYRSELPPAIRERLSSHIERISASLGKLHAHAVARDHVHILIQSDLPPEKMSGALMRGVSKAIRMDFPELAELNKRHFWGGIFCNDIRDERHLSNAVAYIERHKTGGNAERGEGGKLP
jgi:REP element-mobilizing transposase RayT